MSMFEEENKVNVTSIMLGCVFFLAMIPTGMICNGLALCYLWKLFIVPFGINALGVAHAMGIMLIVALFLNGIAKTPAPQNTTNTMATNIGYVLGVSIVNPILLVCLGWFVAKFMF